MAKQKDSGFMTVIMWIVIPGGILALGYLGYKYWKKKQAAQAAQPDAKEQASSTDKQPTPQKVNTGILKEGSTGADVSRLQSMLNQKYNAGLTVDGNFGPKTANTLLVYTGKSEIAANAI